jgi:uncharacterized membrane protein YbhN (UPF0104 family)
VDPPPHRGSPVAGGAGPAAAASTTVPPLGDAPDDSGVSPVRHAALLGVAIAVAVGSCAVVLWRLDWAALSAFDNGESWILLLVAALLHLLTLPLKAVAWRTTLTAALADRQVPVRTVLGPVSVGALFNTVLVGRVGEAVRVILMHSRLTAGDRAAPLPVVDGSAVTESLVSTAAWVVLVAATGLVLPLPTAVWIVVAALGLLWTAVMVVALLSPSADPGAGDPSGFLGRVHHASRRVWWSVAHGHRSLRRPPVLTPLVTVSLLGWLAQAASVYAILRAFDIAGGWAAAALVLISTTVAQTAPLLPGNVGIFQAAAALPLDASFGTPATTAVAAGIVLQLVQAGPVAVVGAISLASGGDDIGRVYRSARRMRGPFPQAA